MNDRDLAVYEQAMQQNRYFPDWRYGLLGGYFA